MRERVEAVYRSDSRQVLATLIRLLGDFDAAEEAMHDAFTAALERWSADGIPKNPSSWLISTGRFKAIDRFRRRARFDASLGAIADQWEQESGDDDHEVGDDRLRLIFTCCHPAISPDAQVALTLREVCDLQTEAIAAAFLVPAPTIAQRIVRAKAKIREMHIPYQIPERADLPERLDAVLRIVYLVFNEGYYASAGPSVTRRDLTREAIRLGRLLLELLPDAEVHGLLALMLLHDARASSRMSAAGDLVLLQDQDRSLWHREQIEEGCALVETAIRLRRLGPYTLQAAIAAVHASAPTAADTDWQEITGLYDLLCQMAPSPITELNRAAALAMRDGPEVGLRRIDALLARGELVDYPLAHSARADLLRRLHRREEALDAYRRALSLTAEGPQRRFLMMRIAGLS